MTSEIYGLKDVIELDDAGEIQRVNYIDAKGQRSPIGEQTDQNPMLPEALDFARVISDPDNAKNKQDYDRWLKLSVGVNRVLFDLRKSAHIKFEGE